MAILDERARLSARIHGLVKASELASSLFERNNDSVGTMVDLGKTAASILSDLASFRVMLGPSVLEVSTRIEAAESRTRPLLAEGVTTTQDMRQIYIRTALVVFAALEAEVSYLLADHQAEIQSLAKRAFEHLQRSIVVDEFVAARWRRAWEAGEVECEKLGAVHLLSHGIWAFKVDAKGGRTDLVYQEPLRDPRQANWMLPLEVPGLAMGEQIASPRGASCRAWVRQGPRPPNSREKCFELSDMSDEEGERYPAEDSSSRFPE
jgi:hypothetical protein